MPASPLQVLQREVDVPRIPADVARDDDGLPLRCWTAICSVGAQKLKLLARSRSGLFFVGRRAGVATASLWLRHLILASQVLEVPFGRREKYESDAAFRASLFSDEAFDRGVLSQNPLVPICSRCAEIRITLRVHGQAETVRFGGGGGRALRTLRALAGGLGRWTHYVPQYAPT